MDITEHESHMNHKQIAGVVICQNRSELHGIGGPVDTDYTRRVSAQERAGAVSFVSVGAGVVGFRRGVKEVWSLAVVFCEWWIHEVVGEKTIAAPPSP